MSWSHKSASSVLLISGWVVPLVYVCTAILSVYVVRNEVISRSSIYVLSSLLTCTAGIMIMSAIMWTAPHAVFIAHMFVLPSSSSSSASSSSSVSLSAVTSSFSSSSLSRLYPYVCLLLGLVVCVCWDRVVSLVFRWLTRDRQVRKARAEHDREAITGSEMSSRSSYQTRFTTPGGYDTYNDENDNSPLFHSSALARNANTGGGSGYGAFTRFIPSFSGSTAPTASTFQQHGTSSLSRVDVVGYREQSEWIARCIMCLETCAGEKALAYHYAGCDHQPFSWFTLSNRALQSVRGHRPPKTRWLDSSLGSTATLLSALLPLIIVGASCGGQLVPEQLTPSSSSSSLNISNAVALFDITACILPVLAYTVFSAIVAGFAIRTSRNSLTTTCLLVAIAAITIGSAICLSLLSPSISDPSIFFRLSSQPSTVTTLEFTWLLMELTGRCMAAGIYVYTGLVEILIEEMDRREGRWAKLIAFVLGVAVVLFADFLR